MCALYYTSCGFSPLILHYYPKCEIRHWTLACDQSLSDFQCAMCNVCTYETNKIVTKYQIEWKRPRIKYFDLFFFFFFSQLFVKNQWHFYVELSVFLLLLFESIEMNKTISTDLFRHSQKWSGSYTIIMVLS